MDRGIVPRRGKKFNSQDGMNFLRGRGKVRFFPPRERYNEDWIPKARGSAPDIFNFPQIRFNENFNEADQFRKFYSRDRGLSPK